MGYGSEGQPPTPPLLPWQRPRRCSEVSGVRRNCSLEETLGPAALSAPLSLRPSSSLPDPPSLAAKPESVSQEMSAASRASLWGVPQRAQGDTSFCFLLGKLRSRGGPSHVPGPRCYLHGCNLFGCNFPTSLRPAPGDAVPAWARDGRSPPQRAPLRATPCRAPAAGAAERPPALVPGRRAGGLVTCPRGSRNSSGAAEPSPDRRGIKRLLPQLSAPSNGLSKNISDAAGKTIPPTLEDDQPCDFLKKGSGVNESHRKSSGMDAGPSWTKAPCGKNSSGKRQSEPQAPRLPLRPKSSLAGVSWPATEEPGGRISPEGKAERSPLEATGNKLFLAVRSMGILKGDADEDSASDLSDSERIPIAPSPRTPPDLRLRAEEIDPACFDLDLHPGQGHARAQHCYPDFLPPRCSSWDLRGMALLVHAERRPGAVPRAGGLLGRYVDRLLQLEWLQIQTVQGERAKGGKARLPVAPGGPPQSPGRGKLLAGAVSRPPQDGAPVSGPSRKKGLPRTQGAPACYPFETPPKPLEVLGGSRLGSQKQTLDARTEEKKKKCTKSPRPPRWHLAGGDSSLAMESSGNIRIPTQPVGTPDSVEARKASKPQVHAHLKKKGNANSCSHASLSGEKKLKTNGGKQNTHKFK